MRAAEHVRRVLMAGAAALLAGGTLLGVAVPAAAAEPAGVVVTTECAADAETACIRGTIRDDNRNPIAGVDIELTAPDGETATATTDDGGAFGFAVTTAGDYRLDLDEGTLPEGVTADAATTTIKGVALSTQKAALFKITGHVEGSENTNVSISVGAQLWQLLTQGLLLGLLLALASLGLSLIHGTTGISNFAHAEQVALGGLLGSTFVVGLGLPFWLAAVLVALAGAASGLLQDLVMWAPLRRRGLGLAQLMVVTIGLSLAAEYLFQYIWGSPVQTVTTTIERAGGPLVLTPTQYASMGVAIVLLVLVGLGLTRTRIGRAVRAVADNRALAAASGIDVNAIIRLVWTVAMGLAALAGILYAGSYGGMQWSTGVRLLLLMFAAVTLGGIGTAFGALVGSLVIGIVVQLMGFFLPGELKYAIALLVLIVVLIFRPQGILGRRDRIG